MTLYERIMELCEVRGISQRQLEIQSGLKRGCIFHWQESTPKIEAVGKIADFFGVSVDYLMGRTEEEYYIDQEAMQLAQQMKNNPTFQVLFDASRNVSPEDMQLVIDMIKRMQK